MLFINTRPIERSQALTQCLRQSGFEVVNLPLLELKPRPFTPALKQLFLQLQQTQIIVVVSPTAVHVGMQYLQQAGVLLSDIQHIQWVAVGRKTAEALADYQVHSHVPEVETSEGMLSLPIFNHLENGTHIAFWRGEGGRQLMMQQCKERHIQVLNFILYERDCPPETHSQFLSLRSQLEQSEQPFWSCISSEASWKNWLMLTKDHPKVLNNGHYLVLGERLYQLLADEQHNQQKCFNISKIFNLEPETILHMILQLQRKP